MTVDLSDISNILDEAVGNTGIDFLGPQLTIIRRARNLPGVLEDLRLVSERFFESLELIDDWSLPLSILVKSPYFDTREETLRQLQGKASFFLKEEGITSWTAAMESKNEEIPRLLREIQQLRNEIIAKRQDVLKKTRRKDISLLFGMVNFPYSKFRTLKDSIDDVEKCYFGPNTAFVRKNKYTDALLLNYIALESLKKQKGAKRFDEVIRNLLERPDMAEVKKTYELAKARPNSDEIGFTERNVVHLASNVLKRRLNPSERNELLNFYSSEKDRYNVLKTFGWFTNILYEEETHQLMSEKYLKKNHLLGLSFMDKHKNNEIIGNVPESSFDLFQSVLSPFNELKQDGCYMQSAQFEIQAMGLPEQAWIYDYSGTKSEILRSTLLLISDKQPKFDMLEACQRLANAVLSGRVDRNDMRYTNSNYIRTDLLPKNSWNVIAEGLIQIMEEALVYEEGTAQRIIRRIFAEEDRSHLITSRKFTPVFQVDLDFKKSRLKELPAPEEISIYAHRNHEFQYRHALASGYPWYYGLGSALEKLVADALRISQVQVRSLKGNVQLRQVVMKVEEGDRQYGYVFYFHKNPAKDSTSIIAFKEAELGQEGISPVEVIFRPHKWLERGPKRNDLDLILDKARATDPKDLQTIISNL